MITLITGVPGVGKTAYAVRELLQLRGERPVFSNINGLTVDHFPIDHEWVQKWHEHAPQDALIVIDECQHSFRPRPQGSKVPENVAAFETHRHLGVDFILITQRPTLIDPNIRGLVGRYMHVRQTALARVVHEAMEVVDFGQKSVREENAKAPYKLPKEVFSLYKSSQLHTKKARPRMPTAVYLLLALVPVIGIAGTFLYRSINAKLEPDSAAGRQAATSGASAPMVATVPGMGSAVDHGQRLRLAALPVDPDDPTSAPIYADVRPAPVAPRVVACVASAQKCVCYTQQASRVWVPRDQCRERVAGSYYDPYGVPVAVEGRHSLSGKQNLENPAPRQDIEATAPQGFEPRPAGPMSFILSPPQAGALIA